VSSLTPAGASSPGGPRLPRPGGGQLWLRFLSGPDIDGLAILDIAVGLAILRRAEQQGAGTMLRYR
jgi:hypothetical protein